MHLTPSLATAIAAIASLASCSSVPASPPDRAPGALTIPRIFSDPSLEGPSPRALKLSPDGSRVTFLQGKKGDFKKLDLWEYELASGQSRMLVDSADLLKDKTENLSAVEKARRERQRISDTGIVEYGWSEAGNALVFPAAGGLYYYPLAPDGPRKLEQLTDGKSHETDAHLSPRGSLVSFVRDSNLFVMNTRSKRARQITRDGGKTIQNGISEFIAQEEMGRFDGQWWSGNEAYLAFTRTDESRVEIAKRYEINADGFEVQEQRYPRTGTRNVGIQLGVLDVIATLGKGQPQVRWLDLGPNPDIYLARVNWLPDHRTLAVQLESRDQKRLDLVFFDARSGKKTPILSEKNDHWIALNDDARFLKKSGRFIWASERSGSRQLYLYDLGGNLIRQLTHQPWAIHRMGELDGDETSAYFLASGASPLEQQLFKVSLDTGETSQVTGEEGWHEIELSKGARYYVDKLSNPTAPPQVSLHSIDGRRIAFLEENRVDSSHPLAPFLKGFSTPVYGSFKSSDGVELYYQLLTPRGFQPGHRYPTIIDVYGGPDVQIVRKAWGGKRYLWHQYLAQQGFVVFSLDNRGSSGRDRAFENPIYHRMGDVEVRDQKAGVEFLVRESVADPARIGVFGWSYGGYMALLCMLKEPTTFITGVSVAPVTDWTLYDTHYTERFLGKPAENADGYEASGALKYIDGLTGHLLMIHGMADDNVLFTNSTKVYKALQDRAMPFEMMAYPGGKHGIYGKMPQIHVYETISRFFERNL